MDEKSSKETAVLCEFLKTRFKEFAITSCEPPKPDCLCDLARGVRVYFELSEVVDQPTAQKFYDKKKEFTGGFFTDDILADCVIDKLTKSYETNELDVELLLFFDLQSLWPERTMLDQLKRVLDSRGKGFFNRVWLFSVPKKEVIGVF